MGQNGSIGADCGCSDAEVLRQAEDSGCSGAVWRLHCPEEIRQDDQVQLLQLVHDQTPGIVVDDGMLVDCMPGHTPAATAATVTGAKPSTASEGLLVCLASSGGAFKALIDDDITFLVWTMLDEISHSLPGSLEALKQIVGMFVVEGTMCVACTHM